MSRRTDASRRGGALLMMTSTLTITIALAALAINVAHMQYTRTELQITTDLATRAACRALVDTDSQAAAYQAAQRLANANRVAGRILTVGSGDLEFAAATRLSVGEKYSFTANDHPNAVRLTASFFQRSTEALPMLLPVFSMATGFRPMKYAAAAQAELDIAIVLDCSSSMLAAWNDSAPPEGLVGVPQSVPATSRWQNAKTGIQAMLQMFRDSPQHERVALTTFNVASLLNAPLANDYVGVESALAVQSQLYLGGVSSIGDGIKSATTMLNMRGLARPWASRVILLISDGGENFGYGALRAADDALFDDIMIYSVSVSAEANTSLMQNLSKRTRGRHFQAQSAEDFVKVMKRVNEHLPILITY